MLNSVRCFAWETTYNYVLEASAGLEDNLHRSRFEIKELVLNVFSHVEEDKADPNRICFYDETLACTCLCVCVFQ
jgi:hypothetical protein